MCDCMNMKKKDTFGRDLVMIIAGMIVAYFIMTGSAGIATSNAKESRDLAIKNAVDAAIANSGGPGSGPLSCKDNEILESVIRLAENGVHVKGYDMKLYVDNLKIESEE